MYNTHTCARACVHMRDAAGHTCTCTCTCTARSSVAVLGARSIRISPFVEIPPSRNLRDECDGKGMNSREIHPSGHPNGPASTLSLSSLPPSSVQGFAGNSAGALLTGARNVARSRDPVVSRDVYYRLGRCVNFYIPLSVRGRTRDAFPRLYQSRAVLRRARRSSVESRETATFHRSRRQVSRPP